MGDLQEFSVTGAQYPVGITVGPDNKIWLTDWKPGAWSVGLDGTGARLFKGSPSEMAGPHLGSIVKGPDGNLWLTEFNNNASGGGPSWITRMTPGGWAERRQIFTSGSSIGGITVGPDKNIWFADGRGNRIGYITAGPPWSVASYQLASQRCNIPGQSSGPNAIAAGPDGNLWFTQAEGSRIARMTTSGQLAGEWNLACGSYPFGITAGPDGNMWFVAGDGNRVGRITMGGEIKEWSLPSADSYPTAIAAGPDGNMWFTQFKGNRIGRISTTTGEITEFALKRGSNPAGIVQGPDNAMWFAMGSGGVGRIVAKVAGGGGGNDPTPACPSPPGAGPCPTPAPLVSWPTITGERWSLRRVGGKRKVRVGLSLARGGLADRHRLLLVCESRCGKSGKVLSELRSRAAGRRGPKRLQAHFTRSYVGRATFRVVVVAPGHRGVFRRFTYSLPRRGYPKGTMGGEKTQVCLEPGSMTAQVACAP